MAKIRVGRVAEQIKKELSLILQGGLKDPRVGFVTVTGVEMSNDLSQAKAYISVLNSDDQQTQDTLQALTQANGYLRSELGRRIRLRHTPELIFKLDESIAYGSRIESLLKGLNDDGERDE